MRDPDRDGALADVVEAFGFSSKVDYLDACDLDQQCVGGFSLTPGTDPFSAFR